MKKQQKTLDLISAAREILELQNPMTLRQTYYQLVAKHIIDNNKNEYQKLSNAMVWARQQELIPWEWIEDRTRQPRQTYMWSDLTDFFETVKSAYRKDVWASQENYIVVWVEKDALSGIFQRIVNAYGVTLIVGRGYNSWSVKKELADMFRAYGKEPVILYFGDFDPSGEDIYRDIEESFGFFQTSLKKIEKVSLTKNDIDKYNLPADFAKKSDTRTKKFIAKNGDMSVELDALPVDILREKIKNGIEKYLDMEKFKITLGEQSQEQQRIQEFLKGRK
jgi:5S rRNA maturation endonuclease (ribonuclease M5)